DLMVMTRQLASMVSAGLTLLKALRVLEEQTEAKKLKETVIDVRKDVESGKSLSAALEAHPKVFSPLYVAMVRAGETGGFLESTLTRGADHLESEAQSRPRDVGPHPSASSRAHRRHRQEDRAGALVAHAVVARHRRCADARGDRGHGAHVGQRGRRARDGLGARGGRLRRSDRRGAAQGA